MSNNTPAPNSTTAPAAAPKRSRKGLILILTAVIVLAGGGGAAYYFLLAKAPEEAAAAEEKKPEAPEGAAVALDPFIVNLADPGARRFLRVTLSVIVEGEEQAKEISENALVKMRIRSAILELLAQQNADVLITPEGKTQLKAAIAEGASKAVEGLHITDVLFSEFVVQF